MILVTQSFGNEQEYKRAIFCIASFYAHCEDKSSACYLFTDNPDYFQKYLNDFPIRYFVLTPDKIKAMRGDIDFLHRMKIALIDEAFEHADQNLLYADSDTFFLKDPSEKMSRLRPDISFMHLPEYSFESMRDWMLPAGVPFRAFINLISENQFKMPDGSALKIDTSGYSWNAGVMMLHTSHKKYIPEVYAITEQSYPFTKNHACEQYAFSIALQRHTTLHRCDDVSYHYWYRVKKKLADAFLQKEVADFDIHPIAESFERIRKITQELPLRIENSVVFLKDASIQSFNENRFFIGYKFAARVLVRSPFEYLFIKDILYHTKRMLIFSR
ncbi:MAG TPA: hypothetical protein VIM65_00165 [Cyclobacteriaceae bacterium]